LRELAKERKKIHYTGEERTGTRVTKKDIALDLISPQALEISRGAN
jgi:hypothetical protein